MEEAKAPGCDEVPDVEYNRLADENLQLRATVEDLQNQLCRAEASRQGCCIMWAQVVGMGSYSK